MKLWEIRKRREFLEKQDARDYLHLMRVVNAGFNGGESASRFSQELWDKANPPTLTLEDKDKPQEGWISRMLANVEKD